MKYSNFLIDQKLSSWGRYAQLFVIIIFCLLSEARALVDEPAAKPAPRLDRASIDPGQITVSGVSSGGFMAVQFHVAHSALVRGAGSVAGGIYWCAEGERGKSYGQCMGEPSRIDVRRYTDKVERLAAAGEIDPVRHLARARVFIFASPSDAVILDGESEKLKEFYEHFLPESQIKFVNNVFSPHGFPTENYGHDCRSMGLPWLYRCGYDTAGEILKQLYANLRPKTVADGKRLRAFDQREFGGPEAKLFPSGSVYVPARCERGSRVKCRLHIALHGCQQSPEYIDEEFRRHAGYNEWAEANDIVVLYPQAQRFNENPLGCWDWFGYTGPDYVVKKGPQIEALKAMVDRLANLGGGRRRAELSGKESPGR